MALKCGNLDPKMHGQMNAHNSAKIVIDFSSNLQAQNMSAQFGQNCHRFLIEFSRPKMSAHNSAKIVIDFSSNSSRPKMSAHNLAKIVVDQDFLLVAHTSVAQFNRNLHRLINKPSSMQRPPRPPTHPRPPQQQQQQNVAAESRTGCGSGKKKRVEQPAAPRAPNHQGFYQPQPQFGATAAGMPPPPPPPPAQPAPPQQFGATATNGGIPNVQQGTPGPFPSSYPGGGAVLPVPAYSAPLYGSPNQAPAQEYPPNYDDWELGHWTQPLDPNRVEAARVDTLLVLLHFLILRVFAPILNFVFLLTESIARKKQQSMGQVLSQYSPNLYQINQLSIHLPSQPPTFGSVQPQQQTSPPPFGSVQPQQQPTQQQPQQPPQQQHQKQHQQQGQWAAGGQGDNDDVSMAAASDTENNGATFNNSTDDDNIPRVVGGAPPSDASIMSYTYSDNKIGKLEAHEKDRLRAISSQLGINSVAACNDHGVTFDHFWGPKLLMLRARGFLNTGAYTTKMMIAIQKTNDFNHHTANYWGDNKAKQRQNLSTWWKWMFFDGEITEDLKAIIKKKVYKKRN